MKAYLTVNANLFIFLIKVHRVKRRKLLKSLGLGLSAGLIMPELLVSCKKSDPGPEVQYDGTVAVIGAGPAGLYAADILRSKGVNVIIFEASGQLGGRVRSYRAPKNTDDVSESFLFVKSTPNPDHPEVTISEPSIADFPLELGPETIIGSDSVWGKIMSDLGISTYNLSDAADEYILGGVVKSGPEWIGDPDYSAVQNFITNLPSLSGSGVSVDASAGVSGRGAPLLNALAGNAYGTNSSNIDAGLLGSELGLAAETHDGKELNLSATLMQDILYTRFINVAKDIKFNTQITSVNYGSDKVTLTDSTGNPTEVDKVIVTVPLSILKSGAIAFSPALPSAISSSLSKFGMDNSIRVILDFKTNFWGDSNTGFIFGGEEAPQYFSAGIGRTQAFRTLTFTINGTKATELSAMGANMITPILAEMDALYDGKASEFVRRTLDDEALIIYTIQDWSKEPFIKGGSSYPLVGATAADRTAISTPISGKIFFAGEVTDVSGNAGTVNGAFASAQRVALEVVDSIVLS